MNIIKSKYFSDGKKSHFKKNIDFYLGNNLYQKY